VKLFGAAKFRAALREKREFALQAADRIGRMTGVRMVAAPQLSLFGFHVEWPGASVAEEDRATRRLLDEVQARGRVLLTGCTAGGRFLARVCVLSFRTRQERIDACVEDVERSLKAVLDGRRP
jgi:aromatic-L-amino-acid decarboxylase